MVDAYSTLTEARTLLVRFEKEVHNIDYFLDGHETTLDCWEHDEPNGKLDADAQFIQV